MKLITLITVAFMVASMGAMATEVVAGDYTISFDGDVLRDSILCFNVSEILVSNTSYESQTLGGTNYTEDEVYIGHRDGDNNMVQSGAIRVIVRNYQPDATSTLPIDLPQTLQDSYWTNSTPRIIDGIKGKIQCDGGSCIAVYKLSANEFVEIDSEYPWGNGTLAFIRSLHVTKNKAVEV